MRLKLLHTLLLRGWCFHSNTSVGESVACACTCCLPLEVLGSMVPFWTSLLQGQGAMPRILACVAPEPSCTSDFCRKIQAMPAQELLNTSQERLIGIQQVQ